MYILKHIFLACMVIVLTSGCATKALVEVTNPNHKVYVSSNDVTEEELQQKGRKYTKHEDGNYGDYYMVEKTPWRKTGDYTLLVVGFPFTLTTDIVYHIILDAPQQISNNFLFRKWR